MNEIQFRDLVRRMLDQQQKYFKGGRLQSDLIASKELEKQVRRELDAGPDRPEEPQQANLFGDDDETDNTEDQDH